MVLKAIKVFLLGLLLWPVLINFVGIISPFWATFVLKDPENGRALLDVFQSFVPLVSVLFAYSLIILSQADNRLWVKVLSRVVGLTYVACSIYGFLPKEGVFHYVLRESSQFLDVVMLFLAGLIMLRVLSQMPEIKRRAVDV